MKLIYRLIPLTQGLMFQVLWMDSRFSPLLVHKESGIRKGLGSRSFITDDGVEVRARTHPWIARGDSLISRINLQGEDTNYSQWPAYFESYGREENVKAQEVIHKTLQSWAEQYPWEAIAPFEGMDFLPNEPIDGLYDGTEKFLEGTQHEATEFEMNHRSLHLKFVAFGSWLFMQVVHCADMFSQGYNLRFGPFELRSDNCPEVSGNTLFISGDQLERRRNICAGDIGEQYVSNLKRDLSVLHSKLDEICGNKPMLFTSDHAGGQDEDRILNKSMFNVFVV